MVNLLRNPLVALSILIFALTASAADPEPVPIKRIEDLKLKTHSFTFLRLEHFNK
jgi:hypothetical protein